MDLHVARIREGPNGLRSEERLVDHVLVTYKRVVRAGKLVVAKTTSSGAATRRSQAGRQGSGAEGWVQASMIV